MDWNKRKLSDKELIRICSQFRTGVLGARGKPKDKCYMVTAPLQSYLKFLKNKEIGKALERQFQTLHQCIVS